MFTGALIIPLELDIAFYDYHFVVVFVELYGLPEMRK